MFIQETGTDKQTATRNTTQVTKGGFIQEIFGEIFAEIFGEIFAENVGPITKTNFQEIPSQTVSGDSWLEDLSTNGELGSNGNSIDR